VGGTASAAEGLNITLTRDDEQTWKLTGTLSKPQVTAGNQEISRKAANARIESKP
jgi:hypothetical protein